MRGRVRSQTAFRSSFALELGGSLFLGMVEFAEVYAVFGRTKTLGGFDYHAVMLMFGFSTLAFGLADLCVGHVENLPTYVRTGTFEAILLRPLSALGQLGTSDFSLRRLGRSLQALVVLAVALRLANVRLTPARVLLIVVTPLLGAVMYGCVFVAAASVSFWFTDAGEFANAFTYGGNYVGTYPFSIYGRALRQFFTFVVPVAFVAYVPTLVLLGRLHSAGWPPWSVITRITGMSSLIG